MRTNALRCALPTTLMVTLVLGNPVSNAESSGCRKRTKRTRNIHSMCRDIAWWEVNEVHIPGNNIEPQWPFLDTLACGDDIRCKAAKPSPTDDRKWRQAAAKAR